MTRSHFIEILMILTKYVFDHGVRLTEFSVTVESITLRFYCIVSVLQWQDKVGTVHFYTILNILLKII